LWVSAACITYGVLTRPLEGSFLLPAVLVLLLPAWKRNLGAGISQVGAWLAGVGITLLLNGVRFGSPLNFGNPTTTGWTTPIWVGFPGALLSPGRGVLWEFPALPLAVVGSVLLWRAGKRWEVGAVAGLAIVLFLEACLFTDWVGGWDWGFRYFQPAFPLVAVLAGAGVGALRGRAGRLVPGALVALGLVWNVPAVATDLLAGYGHAYVTAASNWQLDAYPPLGAWRFLHRVFPAANGAGGVDIVWFRATRVAGAAAMVPFAVLLAASAWLWRSALRTSETA